MRLVTEEKEKPRKIRLGEYPYTYVRVVVMRTTLLARDDYHKLMKMGFNEIARFLQDSNYKDDINRLGVKYSGSELIERALNNNLATTFAKLKRISPDELRLLINAYLKRLDFWNIKTILRGKYVGETEEKIEAMLMPCGELTQKQLIELNRKKTIEEVLKNNGIVDFEELKEALDKFKKSNMLIEIENKLDLIYYNSVLEFIKRLPKQGRLFREFLESEIEVLNILTILRLKKENFKDIENYLFITKSIEKYPLLESLLELKELSETSKAFEKTKYSKELKKGFDDLKDNNSLITLELGFYTYLLKKSMNVQHQNPLSVDVILGFMWAKLIEINNLNLLVKGRQAGMEDEFIESHLVV